ncbi:cytochrome P450 [Amniculicola lignicola CBS 123094]|uniref:Cytochrome P450 monooxygenase ABA1 n=1 Tax=Amniculicola lignicola CBS 123094 TaxID=1392246 RepID=A0A6A5X0J6_9PLEO|nr:cytochrome P450 [Amniculicola lignicola CBS 123094]
MSTFAAKNILTLLIPYLPVLIAVYVVGSSVRTWYRLRHFPGPFLGKFSHIFMAKTAASSRMNLIYTDVNRKYGPLARVGPNDLLSSDPSTIRLMSSARSTYQRSEWYEAMRMDPYVDSIFSEMHVPVHDSRRAKMATAYSGKENPTLESDIDICVVEFLQLIRSKYVSPASGDGTKRMDFGVKTQYFTLDVITKVAYGEAFGYMERDEDVHGYIKTTEEVVPYLNFLSVWPVANAVLNRSWVKEKLGPGPGDKEGMGKLMSVARQVVGERFGPDAKEKQDMLGAFVRNGIPQRQIESEVLFQIIAGSDTTATAIRATFLNLLSNPRVLTKLRNEINDAEGEVSISSPISNAEAKAMPYLQAVIKEGLRIHPPFTGLLSKKVPPGGDTINGQFVPGGTRIAHCTWGIQRNEIYGEDVEVFRPERWIEVDAERLLRMEQTLDLIFGHGRWGCLGKTVAYIELNKIFVELLRHFDFELLNPGKPWRSVNYNLFLQDEMWLRVTEREGK